MKIYGEFPRRNQLRGWTDAFRTGRIHFRVVPWVSAGQVSGASRRDILSNPFVSLIFLIQLWSLLSYSQSLILLTLVWLSHSLSNSQDLDYILVDLEPISSFILGQKATRSNILASFAIAINSIAFFILQNHINRQNGAQGRRGCWA